MIEASKIRFKIYFAVFMHYLKTNYGYLFSLAMRLNPFDPAADAVVKES